MRVKKFVAPTLPEAVARVRADLGPEAIILHTQPVRRGGLFGIFGRRMIEVMAAGEVAELKRVPAAARADPGPAAGTRADPGPAAGIGAEPGPRRPTAPAGEIGQLRAEMARVSSMMVQMLERAEVPKVVRGLHPELKACYAALTEGGVEKELVTALIHRARRRLQRAGGRGLHPRTVVGDLLQRALGRPEIITLQPGQRRVVTLVGPTGVGKTTTLAKLAALFALGKGTRLAVLTTDTYRIAAAEQLRVYCQIIGVPMEVVTDPQEAAGALDRHRDKELVLVDTTGHSHRNAAQAAELQAHLRALDPDEIYLVLSVTASTADALAAAQAFAATGYDRLLLTKLDETTVPGMVYNLAVRTRKPLSYLTTGQNVPDDIEVADPGRFVDLLLGEVQ